MINRFFFSHLLSLISYLLLIMIAITSCTEKMEITPQEGPQLLGVYGSITDEFKKHEITLSRTMDFYATDSPNMVSDATIFAYDGTDTIWFEETDEKGIYETVEEFSGTPNRTYYLSIDLPEYEGGGHYYAQTTMHPNVERIDSIRIKTYKMANVELENVLGLYPYFQSLSDPNTYYMVKVFVNDSVPGGERITNCAIETLGGIAGVYVNGPFMVAYTGEFPIWSFSTPTDENDTLYSLHHGDTVKMELWVIPPAYAGYISDISSSNGSNPMMGTPSNVRTNVGPDGTAVGYFYAATKREITTIY